MYCLLFYLRGVHPFGHRGSQINSEKCQTNVISTAFVSLEHILLCVTHLCLKFLLKTQAEGKTRVISFSISVCFSPSILSVSWHQRWSPGILISSNLGINLDLKYKTEEEEKTWGKERASCCILTVQISGTWRSIFLFLSLHFMKGPKQTQL